MRLPSKHLALAFALAAMSGAASGAADPAVVVTFHQPERYADVSWHRGLAPDILKDIEGHFQMLGKTYLAPGQTVRIEVLDIDLAGEDRLRFGSGAEVRVLEGRADWPRFEVRYAIESAGRVHEARTETISDMNYLGRPIRQGPQLAYEKRMLEEWFKARLARGEAARR